MIDIAILLVLYSRAYLPYKLILAYPPICTPAGSLHGLPYLTLGIRIHLAKVVGELETPPC